MTPLMWNHACSVGIEAMDDQHGVLMDTLNELLTALAHGAGQTAVRQLMERLIGLTRLHFQSEERLMERYAFPGLAAHAEEHQRLLNKLARWHGQALQGAGSELRGVVEGLREWFQAHTEGADQEYGPWLREHGVR